MTSVYITTHKRTTFCGCGNRCKIFVCLADALPLAEVHLDSPNNCKSNICCCVVELFVNERNFRDVGSRDMMPRKVSEETHLPDGVLDVAHREFPVSGARGLFVSLDIWHVSEPWDGIPCENGFISSASHAVGDIRIDETEIALRSMHIWHDACRSKLFPFSLSPYKKKNLT